MAEQKAGAKVNRQVILTVCTVMKYLFPVILLVATYPKIHSKGRILYGILDVAFVFLLTDLLLKKSRHFIWLNHFAMLLINLELMVLYFSGSYVSLVMLQSLSSIEDLGGKAGVYITGAVLLLIFSLLPVKPSGMDKTRDLELLCCVLAVMPLTNVVSEKNYSMLNNIYGVYADKRSVDELADVSEVDENTIDEFYKDGVNGYIEKPDCLSAQPNIILIFTEGLSQNIIEDERNIMPNMTRVQSESISFSNYFNHTFATYRGLEGQLYSGYQLEDIDPNYLVSVQSILKGQGYHTVLVNTEPRNKQYSDYLESFGFDEVVTDMQYQSGTAASFSDREAYEFLGDTLADLEREDRPFFLAIYTFGTHATLDSVDEKFGDGRYNVLNRFYDSDYQFGKFFERFKNSEVFEDTVLVLTSDHATFAEEDFVKAFPDYPRACPDVDRIPLCIYYNGVQPEVIDVRGRNSLDLAPTILDFVDVSAPNYFLGESLFAPKSPGFSYDTIYFDPGFWRSSDEGTIADLSQAQYELMVPKIQKYFAVKGRQTE